MDQFESVLVESRSLYHLYITAGMVMVTASSSQHMMIGIWHM